MLGSIIFGVSDNAQALNTLSRSAPVGRASKCVELPDVQSAPKFGTGDVGTLALRLRVSSESAILASHALNTARCASWTELAKLLASELLALELPASEPGQADPPWIFRSCSKFG